MTIDILLSPIQLRVLILILAIFIALIFVFYYVNRKITEINNMMKRDTENAKR